MARVLLPAALALALAAPAQARPHHPPAKPPVDAAAPAPTAIPAMADRYIEKKVGVYDVALTLRPGNLQLRRVADVSVDLKKILDIPDPVTGDRQPLVDGAPFAVVQGPEVEDRHHHRETPAPEKYRLYPEPEKGRFGFHFTPVTDGLYTVTVTGYDKNDDGRLQPFEVPFRVGAGTFALQTEVSQGAAAVHHEARHPVGSSVHKAQVDRLRVAMEEIGQRTLDLGELLRAHDKGPNVEAAAEARAIEALVASTKGMVPEDDASEGAEYDRLTTETAAAYEELAKAAEAKRPPAHGRTALAQYDSLQPTRCDECHAKYRWGVTSDLGEWPKFAPRKWKVGGAR